jgi:RecA/RadA recombinase
MSTAKKTTKEKKSPANKTSAKKTAVKEKPLTKKALDNLLVSDSSLKGFNVGSVIRSVLDKVPKKKNLPVHCYGMDTWIPSFTDFDDLALAIMTRTRGFPNATCTEIVGQQAAGKTSLVFRFMRYFLKQGSPCYLLKCQNKMPTPTWIKRCLSQNPEEAELFYRNINSDHVDTVTQMIDAVDFFARTVRKEIPSLSYKPIAIFVDSYSKLQPPDMAQGYVDYNEVDNAKAGKAGTPKKTKDLESMIHNSMSHARITQLWARRLGYLMRRYNVNIFIIGDQDDRVDMEGKYEHLPTYMRPKDDTNDTRVGGRAIRVLANFRFVVVDQGNVKQDRAVKAERVRITTVKNQYAPRNTFLDYTLKLDDFYDAPNYLDRVFGFEECFCSYLTGVESLDITFKDGLYFSEQLGFSGVTALEVENFFRHNKEWREWFCKGLDIYGYGDSFKLPTAVIAPDDDEVDEKGRTIVPEEEIPETLSSDSDTDNSEVYPPPPRPEDFE